MSSSRNWSHNSFESAMKHFAPLIKADWMTHLKITPVEYSERFDTLYISIEFELSPYAEETVRGFDYLDRERFIRRTIMFITNYFENYLNTKVGVTKYNCPLYERII